MCTWLTDGAEDSGDIFALAFRRVRWGIAAGSASTPVEGVDLEFPR
jgi:hypothetical protein